MLIEKNEQLKNNILKCNKEIKENNILTTNNLEQQKDENYMLNNTIISLRHELQTQEEKNKSMLSAKQEKITYLDHKLKDATTNLHMYISSTEKYKTLHDSSIEK